MSNRGRRQVTPVRIRRGRNWGLITLVAAVVVAAVGIIGFGGWAVHQNGRSWEDRAADIDGLVNYRKKSPKALEYDKHTRGPLTYTMSPAVGGRHNNDWQNCMGDIYDAPIANEHAVHSLEHGAVWVTYKQGLPADQVDKLKSKVEGKDFILMSPVANLDKNVSLQAWGYQLKLDTVDDPRIDDFISALRTNASVEPGAPCSGGLTITGDTPQDS